MVRITKEGYVLCHFLSRGLLVCEPLPTITPLPMLEVDVNLMLGYDVNPILK